MNTLLWFLPFLSLLRDAAFVGLTAWMFFMLRPQISNLRSTIQVKDAQIDLLEAEKGRLKEQTDPAMAAEYKTVLEFAREMRSQKQQLEQETKEMLLAIKQLKVEKGKTEAAVKAAFTRGIGVGCIEGSTAIWHAFQDFKATEGLPFVIDRRLFELLWEKRAELAAQGKKALEGERPTLPNLARARESIAESPSDLTTS